MIEATLKRKLDNDTNCTGSLSVEINGRHAFQCATLELAWKDNAPQVSCIPTGTYNVIPHVSPTFGECYWVQDVPNRSQILIQLANYASSSKKHRTDLKGCIALGYNYADLNKDGVIEITNSRVACKDFAKIIGKNSFQLTIL
jgi:hypothetical protein